MLSLHLQGLVPTAGTLVHLHIDYGPISRACFKRCACLKLSVIVAQWLGGRRALAAKGAQFSREGIISGEHMCDVHKVVQGLFSQGLFRQVLSAAELELGLILTVISSAHIMA